MSRKTVSVVIGCGVAMIAAGAAWLANGAWAGAVDAEFVPTAFIAQPEGVTPTPEQMLAMMEEQGKPVQEHANCRPLIGTWKAEMSFLIEPGGAPDVTYGTASNKWILGDRFMQTDFEGKITLAGKDIPFRGMGVLGFDRARGEYTMTWVDSLSTQMLFFTGAPGEDDKEITLSGQMLSPEGPVPAKYVFKIESNDKHVLEFWQGMAGMEEMMKIGWIAYTRKAG